MNTYLNHPIGRRYILMITKKDFIENIIKRMRKTLEKELIEYGTLNEMHDSFIKTLKGKFLIRGGYNA